MIYELILRAIEPYMYGLIGLTFLILLLSDLHKDAEDNWWSINTGRVFVMLLILYCGIKVARYFL